jgi:hypothetical protein
MTDVVREDRTNYFRTRRPAAGSIAAARLFSHSEPVKIEPMKVLEKFSRASVLDGKMLSQARIQFHNFDEEARFLRSVVTEFTGNVALREVTVGVIFPKCRPKDEYAQAIAIGQWVQDRTYYVHEGSELFQTPLTTIRLRAGDCDDYALCIASMLGCVGIANKLCILKINGRWAHIFPVAIVNTDDGPHRLTLDGTLLHRSDTGRHEPIDDPIGDLINPIALVKARGDKCEAFFV